ncbi:hypothetical protein BC833DRAFT_588247 [Globomyces pollinis-pini]|nr:hypothetical protein BC833DRAFT_588247 [Globomyces pollinis-pini]
MFSRAFVPCRLRCYSTPKKALKLWVKHNGSPSTKVPIKGCNDLDDFAKKVKQELNTHSQVAIYTSLDKEALDPGLAIKDLLKTDLNYNSSKIPLFVKIIPATPDSITTKTIYIRDTDEDGEFTDKYVEYQIKNREELRDIYKFGLGLATLAEPNKAIVSFDQIKDRERYQVYKYSQDFQGWQKKEADAMEAETLLSMKTYLMEKLLASSIDLPTDIYDSKGKQIQEWDGVLLSGDTLYLLEAKHSISVEKVKEMAGRVKRFPQIMELSTQKEFNIKYNKIVGVACATQFPDESRMEARRLGIMIVYPSGRRYLVESDKIDFDYAIER